MSSRTMLKLLILMVLVLSGLTIALNGNGIAEREERIAKQKNEVERHLLELHKHDVIQACEAVPSREQCFDDGMRRVKKVVDWKIHEIFDMR